MVALNPKQASSEKTKRPHERMRKLLIQLKNDKNAPSA
jgi:hypothetical protein